MELYLIRHGEAYSTEEDFERPLNPRGQSEVALIANYLKNEQCLVEHIYHSEKLRSLETAEIIANALALSSQLKLLPSLDPDEDVFRLIGDLHEFSQNTMVVGHLPNLALLASFMLTGDITRPSLSFLTATTACFELQNEVWKLKWSIDPQSLRKQTK